VPRKNPVGGLATITRHWRDSRAAFRADGAAVKTSDRVSSSPFVRGKAIPAVPPDDAGRAARNVIGWGGEPCCCRCWAVTVMEGDTYRAAPRVRIASAIPWRLTNIASPTPLEGADANENT